jgi:hypothetical protein
MNNLTLTYVDKSGNEVKFTGDLKQLFNYLVDQFVNNG